MRYIHGNYITNNISVALFGIVVQVVGELVAQRSYNLTFVYQGFTFGIGQGCNNNRY